MPLGVSLKAMQGELLQQYIETATEQVEDFCERVFAGAYHEVSFIGDGSSTYLTWEYPIVKVVSLKYAPLAELTSFTSFTVGTDIVQTSLDSEVGRIRLASETFSASNMYTLEYYAGYAVLPWAIKQATALFVTELLRPDYAGIQGQNVDIVPESSQQIVDFLVPRYKRKRI